MQSSLSFVTDRRPGEPCILTGHRSKPLIFKTLEGEMITVIHPLEPWTHERLEALMPGIEAMFSEELERGADAYLGDEHWIGSTEI